MKYRISLFFFFFVLVVNLSVTGQSITAPTVSVTQGGGGTTNLTANYTVYYVATPIYKYACPTCHYVNGTGANSTANNTGPAGGGVLSMGHNYNTGGTNAGTTFTFSFTSSGFSGSNTFWIEACTNNTFVTGVTDIGPGYSVTSSTNTLSWNPSATNSTSGTTTFGYGLAYKSAGYYFRIRAFNGTTNTYSPAFANTIVLAPVRFATSSVASGTTYSTGQAQQSTTTITGSGTTWTAGMVGSTIVYGDGTSALITGFTNATTLTSSTSQTKALQNYVIGPNVGTNAMPNSNVVYDGQPVQWNMSLFDSTNAATFNIYWKQSADDGASWGGGDINTSYNGVGGTCSGDATLNYIDNTPWYCLQPTYTVSNNQNSDLANYGNSVDDPAATANSVFTLSGGANVPAILSAATNNGGTASQSGTAITGTGTSWTSSIVGSNFTFADGTSVPITAWTDATHITSSISQNKVSQAYTTISSALTVTPYSHNNAGCSSVAGRYGMSGFMYVPVITMNSIAGNVVSIPGTFGPAPGILTEVSYNTAFAGTAYAGAGPAGATVTTGWPGGTVYGGFGGTLSDQISGSGGPVMSTSAASALCGSSLPASPTLTWNRGTSSTYTTSASAVVSFYELLGRNGGAPGGSPPSNCAITQEMYNYLGSVTPGAGQSTATYTFSPNSLLIGNYNAVYSNATTSPYDYKTRAFCARVTDPAAGCGFGHSISCGSNVGGWSGPQGSVNIQIQYQSMMPTALNISPYDVFCSTPTTLALVPMGQDANRNLSNRPILYKGGCPVGIGNSTPSGGVFQTTNTNASAPTAVTFTDCKLLSATTGPAGLNDVGALYYDNEGGTNYLYACTGGLWQGTGTAPNVSSGLYYTTSASGYATWTACAGATAAGLPVNGVFYNGTNAYMVAGKKDPTNPFSSSTGYGVYKSTAGATGTFSLLAAQPTGATNAKVCTAITGDATHLFVGSWGGGVFYSSNNGTAWSQANGFLPVTASQSASTTVTTTGSPWTSAIVGTTLTWADGTTETVTGFIDANNVTCSLNQTKSSQTAYFSTQLFYDAAAPANSTSWGRMCITSLCYVPSIGLFAGTTSGAWFSPDNGQNWTQVASGYVNAITKGSSAIPGATYVFVATENDGVIMLTINTYSTGTAAQSGPSTTITGAGGATFASTMYSGYSPNGGGWLAYTGASAGNVVRIVGYSGGVLTVSASQTIAAQTYIVISPITSSLVNGTGTNLLPSTSAYSPVTYPGDGIQPVKSLVYNSANSTLYGGTPYGVYQSTDNGTNWTTNVFPGTVGQTTWSPGIMSDPATTQTGIDIYGSVGAWTPAIAGMSITWPLGLPSSEPGIVYISSNHIQVPGYSNTHASTLSTITPAYSMSQSGTTITGSNFSSTMPANMSVRWNDGSVETVTYVNSTTLTASSSYTKATQNAFLDPVISQSGTTITFWSWSAADGFTSDMIGASITLSDGTTETITAVASLTSATASVSHSTTTPQTFTMNTHPIVGVGTAFTSKMVGGSITIMHAGSIPNGITSIVSVPIVAYQDATHLFTSSNVAITAGSTYMITMPITTTNVTTGCTNAVNTMTTALATTGAANQLFVGTTASRPVGDGSVDGTYSSSVLNSSAGGWEMDLLDSHIGGIADLPFATTNYYARYEDNSSTACGAYETPCTQVTVAVIPANWSYSTGGNQYTPSAPGVPVIVTGQDNPNNNNVCSGNTNNLNVPAGGYVKWTDNNANGDYTLSPYTYGQASGGVNSGGLNGTWSGNSATHNYTYVVSYYAGSSTAASGCAYGATSPSMSNAITIDNSGSATSSSTLCVGSTSTVNLTYTGGVLNSPYQWYRLPSGGGSGFQPLTGPAPSGYNTNTLTVQSASVTSLTDATYGTRSAGNGDQFYMTALSGCLNTVTLPTYTLTVGSPDATGMSNNDYAWAGYTSSGFTAANNWLQLSAGPVWTLYSTAGGPPAGSNVFISNMTGCTTYQPHVQSGGTSPTNVNATIQSTGTLYIDDGVTYTTTGNFTNNGTLYMSTAPGNAAGAGTGNGILSVGGNFTNSTANFYPSISTLKFTGGSGSNMTTNGITLYNLTQNKSSAALTLLDQATVAGTLTFTTGTSGQILLGTNNLIISSGNAIAGTYNASNYVVTNNTGYLQINNMAANSNKDFPIGPSTSSYTPLNINQSSTSTTSNFSAYACGYVNSAGTCSGGTQSLNGVNNTWFITSSAFPLTGSGATVTLLWNTNAETGMTSFTHASCAVNHYYNYGGGATYWWAVSTSYTAGTNNPTFGGVALGASYYSQSASGYTKFSPFGVSSTRPLPIQLINFTAKARDNKYIDLTWKTSSETNNDYFTIDRSKDAVNFETLPTHIKGAGTSSEPHSYETFDYAPYEGTSYYRLKQTDFDGAFTYSDPVAVDITTIGSLVVAKNSASYNYILDFKTAKTNAPDNYTITIINGLGQLVFSDKLTDFSGEFTKEYDFASKGAGVYLVTVSSSSDHMTKRIVAY